VRTEPVDIEGLAGPVVVTVNRLTGKPSITVGGHPATRIRRATYTLPTADGGTVAARLRTSLADPYPIIEIAGVKHRTGPSVPLALRVLALLPIALVAVGGAIGGAIGVVGVIGNLAILRGARSAAVNAVLLIVVLVAAVVAWTIVVAALTDTPRRGQTPEVPHSTALTETDQIIWDNPATPTVTPSPAAGPRDWPWPSS
jgi:hypothetical protein